MARAFIVRARAERDIQAVFDWYETQRAGLGEEFLDHLRRTLEILRRHPEGSPVLYKNVRRAVTSKFPYSVFYVAEHTCTAVLAVLHTSRDPRIWSRHR
jgi:plasmid stabilization system protein ParE